MWSRGKGRAGRLSRVAAFAFLPLLFPGCGSLDNKVKTCSTEIPDERDELAGCIVDDDLAPVEGITVVATRIVAPAAKMSAGGLVPRAPDYCSTETDRLGQYRCGRMERGNYLVTASDPAHKRSILPQSFDFSGGRLISMRTDTLQPHGELEVKVVRAPSGEPLGGVLCDLVGRQFLAKTDDDGNLVMSVPMGTYNLRCDLGDFFTEARVKGVTVRSGERVVVPVSISSLHESKPRPPGPDTASWQYDPIRGVVRITWPRVPVRDIIYVIYRVDPTRPDIYETSTTTDTQFTHVVYWPTSETGRVQARSKYINFTISTAYASNPVDLSEKSFRVSAATSPPLFLGPELTVQPVDGKSECHVGDTARVVGTWRNPFRANSRQSWTLAETGALLRPERMLSDSSGVDTLAFPCTAPGTPRIKLTVTDTAGIWAAEFLHLTILPKP